MLTCDTAFLYASKMSLSSGSSGGGGEVSSEAFGFGFDFLPSLPSCEEGRRGTRGILLKLKINIFFRGRSKTKM